MTGVEAAGLIGVVVWLGLTACLAVVLVKLVRALRETRQLMTEVAERAVPMLAEATAVARSTHDQLARVDQLTTDVADITTDVREFTHHASSLSETVNSTVAGPLVKIAALGHGVRQALPRPRFGTRRPTQPTRRGAPRTVPAPRRADRRRRS